MLRMQDGMQVSVAWRACCPKCVCRFQLPGPICYGSTGFVVVLVPLCRFKAIKGTEVAKKLSALKKTQQALTTKTAAAAAVQAGQPASKQQQEFNELRGMVAKLKRKGQQQQEQQQQQGAGAGSKKARK
jgi:hypothetical protein